MVVSERGSQPAWQPLVNVVVGTGKADVRRGTADVDHIYGGAGNDVLDGRDGPDRIDGGPGNDVLDGGAGSDRLYGGPGNDVILAADGTRDEILCGGGRRDRVTADGADIVHRTCEFVRRSAERWRGIEPTCDGPTDRW
jgi:Ca2+-binding RTX toxin-like protein